MLATERSVIEAGAAIPTWFGIGGGADALARPRSPDHLRALLADYDRVRVLGDGANLLVDDAGVDGLVIAMDAMRRVGAPERVRGSGEVILSAEAGAQLPRLINDAVRDGLSGLEALGGIPATLGGAVMMNAGGAFGQIADAVERVHAFTRSGEEVTLRRADIDFGYRRSGLQGLIITAVDLRLHPGDPAALRDRHLEVMRYKKQSQPMADRSAGCVWKNPEVPAGWSGPRSPDGTRISAGYLIDQAGLKGLRSGGASVSPVHANFVVIDHGHAAAAADVMSLMRDVRRRVFDRFGVTLDPEVVIWRRGEFSRDTGGRAAL